MNKLIKSNLENLYNTNFNLVRSYSLPQVIDQLISDESNTKFINFDGTYHYGLKGDDLSNLLEAKNNRQLNLVYNQIINQKLDIENIKSELRKVLFYSFSEAKNYLQDKNIETKHQVVFIEHDYEPFAYLRAYGKGLIPLLDSPQYFNFKLGDELYAGIGKINYHSIWKEMLEFENLAESLGLDDIILESGLYKKLKNSIIFRTYLLLHEVFDEIADDLFNIISIKDNLMVYGNEHDCESINIYAFS